MKSIKASCLAPLCALLLSTGVQADPILSGNWAGDWAGSGITATFDMIIDQAPDGSISGSIEWTCLTAVTCYGVEEFEGFFDSAALHLDFETTALIDPYLNLGFSVYHGTVAEDGNSMWGWDETGGEWGATRVGVPEPGTLALLGGGLFAIALTRRRKTA